MMIQLSSFLKLFFLFAADIRGASTSDKSSPVSMKSTGNTNRDIISEDEKIVFFSEKLVLKMPVFPKVLDFHGKFISSTLIRSSTENLEMELLTECSSLVYDLVELKEPVKINIRKKKFMKKFKGFLEKDYDPENLSKTLLNRHCEHAIASCSVDDFGAEFLKKLFVDAPSVVEKQLGLFGNLDEFSFMTVPLADIYYKDCNYLLTPFALRALVETVSLPVMVHLLKMWDYDLRHEDARNVLEFWGSNDEFVTEVEKDPRSWLLWAQVGIFKPFPLDKLIAELDGDNPFFKLYMYANLILAFVRDSEIHMNNLMSMLEYMHADLHKNDIIQEEFMTPEIVQAQNSRKWDLWNEWSQPEQNLISDIMTARKCLIKKLKSFEIEKGRIPADEFNNQIFLESMISIMSVPLHHFSRSTYLKSRDLEEVIAAQNNYQPIWFGLTPIPRVENLTNENYWTVLWKQLEIFGIELSYDENISKESHKAIEICYFITHLAQQIKNFQKSYNRPLNVFWTSRLAMFVIAPLSDDLETSKIYMNILNTFDKFRPIGLQSQHIEVIKLFLHSEATEDQTFKLENNEFAVNAYLFAPEILSRENISFLLRTVELRDISLKTEPENIMKLRYLNDFTVDDFKEFFKLGGRFHLEAHEALYTADSTAVAGYFKATQGACNYPENLIWWVHPRAFDNLEFCDIVAEIITFSAFIKHPHDCEELNLSGIINDIVGRIKRNPSEDPHKLIIKWLLNLEWIFLQFYNYYGTEQNAPKSIAVEQWDKILKSFQISRTKLIKWINDPANSAVLEEKESILRLIEWIPLSYMDASDLYQFFLFEMTKTDIGDEKGKFSSIRNRFRDYKFFSSKSSPSKFSIKDIETAVDESLGLCKDLIDHHFDIIEKQIWLNRIKMFTFSTVIKYTTYPIPKRYVFDLMDYKTVPHQDLKIFFVFLACQGHASYIKNRNLGDPNSEYLNCEPESAVLKAELSKEFDSFILSNRSELLRIDLENAKKAKKALK